MKKIMLLLLFVSTLLACHNTESEIEEAVIPAGPAHQHKDSTPEESTLSLNKGAKWNGDESTNSNVKNLVTIVNRFKQDKSINAIQQSPTSYKQAG